MYIALMHEGTNSECTKQVPTCMFEYARFDLNTNNGGINVFLHVPPVI